MLRTILIACKNYWMPQLLSLQTGRYWCIFITILIVINYPAVSRVTFTTLQTSSKCRFTFHASLSQIGLGYTLRQDMRNEYQVVSVDELPWYTSAKLAQKHVKHQDEQQWDMERALITHTRTPNSPLYWPLFRKRLQVLEHIMPWTTRKTLSHTEASQPPQQDLSRCIIEDCLNPDVSNRSFLLFFGKLIKSNFLQFRCILSSCQLTILTSSSHPTETWVCLYHTC